MNNKTDLIVKDWYIQEYPDDELGVEIKDKITFEDLHKALQNGDDIYDFLGDVDSIVRERCFDKLAQLLDKDYDYIYRLWLDNGDSDFMNEHIVKKSLKESTELDRQAFVSLVKLGDKPYDGYSILNDGNFVKRLYADSDEDAISQFRDWIGRGGTRLKESAKLTEDTSYTRQQLIDAVKNAYGFTNKEALAWIKKASDEAKREVVNGFRQNARKNFYDESLKEGVDSVSNMIAKQWAIDDASAKKSKMSFEQFEEAAGSSNIDKNYLKSAYEIYINEFDRFEKEIVPIINDVLKNYVAYDGFGRLIARYFDDRSWSLQLDLSRDSRDKRVTGNYDGVRVNGNYNEFGKYTDGLTEYNGYHTFNDAYRLFKKFNLLDGERLELECYTGQHTETCCSKPRPASYKNTKSLALGLNAGVDIESLPGAPQSLVDKYESEDIMIYVDHHNKTWGIELSDYTSPKDITRDERLYIKKTLGSMLPGYKYDRSFSGISLPSEKTANESLKESKTLTERKWRYTLKSGVELRRAIQSGDYEDIRQALIDCYDELLNKGLIDEYDHDDWAEEVRDYDFESDDDVDFELGQLYDLCDNIDVFVALDFEESLKEATTPEQRARRRGKLTTPYDKTYTLSLKNRYNYTVIQYRVNEKDKTIEKGLFNWGDGKGSFFDNRKELQRHIDDLLAQGYKMIESKDESLKEDWYHFEYESGANPYIAKSERERDRIIRKYQDRVEDLGSGNYLIHDKEEDLFSVDESIVGKTVSNDGKALGRKLRREFGKGELTGGDNFRFNYQPRRGARKSIQTEPVDDEQTKIRVASVVDEEDMNESLEGRDRKKFITLLTNELQKEPLAYSRDEANDIAIKRADALGKNPYDSIEALVKSEVSKTRSKKDESLNESAGDFCKHYTREELLAHSREVFKALLPEDKILLGSRRPIETDRDFAYAGTIVCDGDYLRWRHFGSSANDATLEDFEWIINNIFDDCKYFVLCPLDTYYDRKDKHYKDEFEKRNASLKEDTVKQGNAWVNKGKEGTHGKFKTKKAADAQRKAMFANAGKNRNFGESLKEDTDTRKQFYTKDYFLNLTSWDKEDCERLHDYLEKNPQIVKYAKSALRKYQSNSSKNKADQEYLDMLKADLEDQEHLLDNFSDSVFKLDTLPRENLLKAIKDGIRKYGLNESLKESADDTKALVDFLKSLKLDDEVEEKVIGDWTVDAWTTEPRLNFSRGFYEVRIDNDKLNKHFSISDCMSQKELEYERDRVIKNKLGKLLKEGYIGGIAGLGMWDDDFMLNADSYPEDYVANYKKIKALQREIRRNFNNCRTVDEANDCYKASIDKVDALRDEIVNYYTSSGKVPIGLSDTLDYFEDAVGEFEDRAIDRIIDAMSSEDRDSYYAKFDESLGEDKGKFYAYMILDDKFDELDTPVDSEFEEKGLHTIDDIKEYVKKTYPNAKRIVKTCYTFDNKQIKECEDEFEIINLDDAKVEEKKETAKDRVLAKKAKLKESNCSEPEEKPEFLHKGDWVWDDVACDWYDNNSGDYHLELVHNSELPFGDNDEDIQAVFGLKESADWTSDEILAIVDKLNADGIATTTNKGIADAYAANENPYRRFEVSKADDKDEWTIKVVWKDDTFESDDIVEESLENIPTITNLFGNYDN